MDKPILTQLANVETFRYADDKAEAYEKQVIRRISELMTAQEINTVDGRNIFFRCEEVN